MRLRTIRVVVTLALGVFLAPLAADAQPPGKISRIGVLASHNVAFWDAFRQGLRELGYVEGRTVVIEYRWAEGNEARFPQLAADLVRLKVDVIVTWGTPAALAAKNATNTIPIVMASSGNPIGTGLVASLARPGGNITGLSSVNPDLEGKRLELLKEVVPRLSRVVVLWNPANPLHEGLLKELQAMAQKLGVQLQPLGVQSVGDFESAFATMAKEHPDALVVEPDNFFVFHRKRIIDFAARIRLPTVFTVSEFADAGGLLSYGADYYALFGRAATYVDKILKGAKPADLPVEQPMKFKLVINRASSES